jgi:serine/threonine protein kinase
VILDFGLVAEVEGKKPHDSIALAGTPDYMSPEQGAQLPISRASDWYSVGVMLVSGANCPASFFRQVFRSDDEQAKLDPPRQPI